MDCPDGKTMAYPLSLRHIEEMMRERGVFVDHATVHRCAIKMVPVLAAEPEGGLLNPLQTGFRVTRII